MEGALLISINPTLQRRCPGIFLFHSTFRENTNGKNRNERIYYLDEKGTPKLQIGQHFFDIQLAASCNRITLFELQEQALRVITLPLERISCPSSYYSSSRKISALRVTNSTMKK